MSVGLAAPLVADSDEALLEDRVEGTETAFAGEQEIVD